eukprot:TRINITY_DN687_c1_g1_i1.p1 TRINITY_DN687_c1_g1~~TRINITY_DN687_c1_g1_i1.p1  ORF type:complete len:243 (-),score=42.54 TRINITY_DN687_c1_g1_i1:284-991(-)
MSTSLQISQPVWVRKPKFSSGIQQPYISARRLRWTRPARLLSLKAQQQDDPEELDLGGDENTEAPPPLEQMGGDEAEELDLGGDEATAPLEEQQMEQVEDVMQEGEPAAIAEESSEEEVMMTTGSYLVDNFTGSVPDQMFGLNFIWQEKVLGISVDQLFSKGQRAPVTEYFFWPAVDAWEEIRVALSTKEWVPEVNQILVMNRCTEVINYWQEEGVMHSKEEAEAQFKDCLFLSS